MFHRKGSGKGTHTSTSHTKNSQTTNGRGWQAAPAGSAKHVTQSFSNSARELRAVRMSLTTSYQMESPLVKASIWLRRHVPTFYPKDPGRVAWDIFIMVFIIYNAVTVPLIVSYGLPSSMGVFDILNWCIDLLFLVDICINFRTAYFNEQGNLVCP